MSKLNDQLTLAVNKGLISQDLADRICASKASMNDFDACMSDVVDYDALSFLWEHCMRLTLDSARTRLNNLKQRNACPVATVSESLLLLSI